MRPNLLVIGPKPPPLHGVSYLTECILKSEYLQARYSIRYIEQAFSSNLSEMGRLSLSKVSHLVNILFKELWCLAGGVGAIYLPLGLTALALIRDVVLVLPGILFRVPVVVCVGGQGLSRLVSQLPILGRIAAIVLSRSYLIAPSEAVFAEVRKTLPRAKVVMLPHGIAGIGCVGRKPQPRTKNAFFLSNLLVQKGVLDLVRAIPLVLDRVPDATFTIAGGPGDTEALEAVKSVCEDYECVTYLGAVYGVDREPLFADASIFVFPTHREGFGLVVVEAMSAGLPVVGTRVGGLIDLVKHGTTGLLVPAHDHVALADRIVALLRDPGRARQMGASGRARFDQNFTIRTWERGMDATIVSALRDEAASSFR